MKRALATGLATLLLPLLAQATEMETTAESVLRCLRDNLPTSIALRVRAETEVVDGDLSRQEWLYANRPSKRKGRDEHWLRMVAPAEVAGVVHLFRPLDEGLERLSFLPALGRVRRVEAAAAVAGLDDIVGLEALQEWQRWPHEASLTLGAPRVEHGRSVRPLYATRQVGEAGRPRFERMEGRFDETTCLLLRLEWRDAEGASRGSVTLDPLGLRQRDGHWLPTRMDVLATDGRRSRLQLIETRLTPMFGRAVFDPRGFYRATAEDVGLEATSLP